MRLSLFAASLTAAFVAFAEETAPKAEAPIQESAPSVLWGFGECGVYSGYQLYGSLLNKEPVAQAYFELNANLPFEVGPLDNLGYLGIGLWQNSDLTTRRHRQYRRAFNEIDPNVHWAKTFWFDDDKTWGLDYRTSVIWYYYPHTHKPYTATTVDWNHQFALLNPYVVPFFDWVHEYHENKANLFQFGLRRTFEIGDSFTLTPSVTCVVRSHRYNWCFATAGFREYHNGGLATVKAQLDARWNIAKNYGLFAKVACSTTVDRDLRDAADHGGKRTYGHYKDFVWGGIGVFFNF